MKTKLPALGRILLPVGCLMVVRIALAQEASPPREIVPMQPPPTDGPVPFISPQGTVLPPPPPYPPEAPPGAEVMMPPPPPMVLRRAPLGVWFNIDYLLWWTKKDRVPAIVTDWVSADSGILGPASAPTLFSGGDINNNANSGARVGLGFWFTENQVLGLEGGYFFLDQDRRTLASGQEPTNVLGAPSGTFVVASPTGQLQSAEVNGVLNLASTAKWRIELLGGFRYLELNESLHVVQDFNSADFGQEDTWDDAFRTSNQFYGGQLGVRAEYGCELFFFDISGKLGMGATNQNISLRGGLTEAITTNSINSFGNVVQTVQVSRDSSGGLLVTPACFHRNYFTVVPEFGFNAGYQFTSLLRASLGYNFLFWSSVVRPGEQVTGVPQATNFWAQGLSANLTIRF
jgi:Putative beta barrel porin-7 (BBP7)